MTKRISIALLLACGVARADVSAVPHALVVHVPPTSSEVGAPIELEAMIDAPFAEQLSVRWRQIGDASWHDVRFERSSAGGWYATLPPAQSPGVEYYIRGTDSTGAEVDHFASQTAPHVVHVDPTLYDRLEVLDRARLEGRTEEVSVDVDAHDYDNRYGIKDHYVRGEIIYTHRVLRVLHEVGFGFGSIQGTTPETSAMDAMAVTHGARYGFGQVRLRLHPSVFVDARIGLGVSDQGFEENVRGAIIFGKPWRSCVTLGAEYMGDLGPSAWARLQWDTVPPLLMGASVWYTELPNAALSAQYVAYDVAYQMGRTQLRATISYGSRDGPAAVGGGLGAAVGF
jgi:hypothetical protein